MDGNANEGFDGQEKDDLLLLWLAPTIRSRSGNLGCQQWIGMNKVQKGNDVLAASLWGRVWGVKQEELV